jgi:DNA-binding MarR family transcriptional regulator
MRCSIQLTSIEGDARAVSVLALRAFADEIEFQGRDPATPFEAVFEEAEPRPPLTTSQTKVYMAIVAHYRDHRVTPTLRELCVRTGIKATHGVWEQLRRLERKKYIEVVPGTTRGIKLLGVTP